MIPICQVGNPLSQSSASQTLVYISITWRAYENIFLGPTSKDSEGLGLSLRICISVTLPAEAG